ncbi:hypothetical protein RCOM_1551240 [Ricinus communis]|uniref:DUF4283 domain-containing protein n=1 Tax=Ricinus communis TaxID=3988 RepID=B9RPS4_RICCO|nr:hypothetical protein RCOM_1551240 [Ricinus communis]
MDTSEIVVLPEALVFFRDKLMQDSMNLEKNLGNEQFDGEVDGEDIREFSKEVVVKLLGRPISYKALCSRLEGMWPTEEKFAIIDLDNYYFLLQFKTEKDAQSALLNGPRMIMGHYLMVRPWSPEFDSAMNHIQSVIIWIRLLGMPIHFYHRKVLKAIGNIVGKVMRID